MSRVFPFVRFAFAAILTVVAIVPSASAQGRGGVVGDLVSDVDGARDKIVALAKAMPEGTYDWRPSAGVRSVREVFLHVASDNYFIPTAFGVAIDPATGISASDPKTLATFEHQKLGRAAMVAAVEKSFAHLDEAMRGFPDARLTEQFSFFGQQFTGQHLWIVTATHLHEHLGQAIAYARSNSVVPPWSK